MQETSTQKAVLWSLAGVLFVCLGGLCFFEINSLWTYGHNGFNTATYAHAARNMLWHDTWGLAKYHYGFEAPPNSEYYTRHPYLLSYFTAALYAVFGHHGSELIARIVPISFTILSGGAIFELLRRHRSLHAAVFGLAVFTLMPVITIFAPMLDHEQGCFFFSLLYVGLYIAWLKDPDWKTFVGVLVTATLSVQYDWTGYYMALPVALHAFGYGIWKADKLLTWRREYTFVAVFSAVILVNFGGFLWAMGQLAGGFDLLTAGFDQRSQWPAGYLDRLFEDADKMFMYPLLAVSAAWLLRMLQRWFTGHARLFDFLPLVFLWAQGIRSLVFAQAGFIHIYWVYYAAAFVALAAGDLFGELAVGLPKWLSTKVDESWRVPVYAGALIAATALLAYQTPKSFDKFLDGREKGGSVRLTLRSPFNHNARISAEIGNRLPDGWLLTHRSVVDHSPQLRWYWNRPTLYTYRTSNFREKRDGVESGAVMFDLRRIELEKLRRLMENHPVTVFDGAYLVADLTREGQDIETVRYREREPGLWYRYSTSNRVFAPGEWVADPVSRARIDEVLSPLVPGPMPPIEDPIAGGGGGGGYRMPCPKGAVLTGVHGTVDREKGFLMEVAPICGAKNKDGTIGDSVRGPLVRSLSGRPFQLACPSGQFVQALRGRHDVLIKQLELECASSSESSKRHSTGLVGPPEGRAYRMECQEGAAAAGLHGRIGAALDAIGMVCRAD